MNDNGKKENASATQTMTEIRDIFADVNDVNELNDDDVMKRIKEYLEGIDPNAIEQNGVFMDPEDVIALTDEDGNQLHFVEAAEMNMEGKTYALLQSIDDSTAETLMSGDSEVYVFEVVSEGEEKVYVPVEDDALLDDIVKNYEVMLSEYYNAQEESDEGTN